MLMDLNKISNFIKTKRKELGITQDELAEKLFVTEKAISRWETGRGTPDISLLLPLSKELNIDVSELLNGEENKKSKNDIEQLIEYNEITKVNKYNFQFRLTIFSITFIGITQDCSSIFASNSSCSFKSSSTSILFFEDSNLSII